MGGFVGRSEHLKGTKLGGYEIVRLIGHGATASVFEATHVALGKPVAIKILHEHLAADEQLRGRFVREGRIAARLRHPHTVEVVDVGLENGAPYLVMELLEGGDLRALLADVFVLSIEHALGFLLPIASALAQAHDVGILHRDLKPANIFLSRDIRGDVVPKLVDFGLSKISDEQTTSLTATQLVAGTVLYMAPEQTLGVKYSSPASDQYSLAVILYEAVTGEAPFTADGVYALLERIRTDVARPPSRINPRIPEDFDAIVLRALSRDPLKRFGSVRAFARALLPFASAETRHAFERDFFDRASATAPAASRPSIRKAVAEAETRSVEPPRTTSSASSPALAARPPKESIRSRDDKISSSAIRNTTAPLPCPPGTSPFHIKGISYRSFVLAVTKTLPGGLDAFCDALPEPALRDFVRQPFLATARYDIFPFVPLCGTLAQLLGVSLDRMIREQTAVQARYDAKTVFKAIWANTTTVEAIADRLTRFGTQWYDFGKVIGTVPEPHTLVVVHEGFPAYITPWTKPMHTAYSAESIRIAGGEDVRVLSETATPSGTKDGFPLVTMSLKLHWGREVRSTAI